MKRVLICDDAVFMRMSIKKFLVAHDFEVAGEARTALEAIQEYKLSNPDLVLMYITITDMDGIKAVQEIKKYDPQAVIIMCSAMGQQDKVFDAIQAGARDFIVKPFDEERLVAALERWS